MPHWHSIQPFYIFQYVWKQNLGLNKKTKQKKLPDQLNTESVMDANQTFPLEMRKFIVGRGGKNDSRRCDVQKTLM